MSEILLQNPWRLGSLMTGLRFQVFRSIMVRIALSRYWGEHAGESSKLQVGPVENVAGDLF
jgi:hypothetical protein